MSDNQVVALAIAVPTFLFLLGVLIAVWMSDE